MGMSKEVRIEHYLLQLDRELQGLPVSQRAEIITEIKSHIYGSLEKDGQRTLESVLSDLGAPRMVAGRYLGTKGVLPKRTNRSARVLKWLAVGTVVFFGAVFILGITLVWYFSPIVKLDGERGRVTLLGGLIDVDENLGQVKIGNVVANEALHEGLKVKGEEDLSNQHVERIKIPFNTARIKLKPAADRKLKWECKAAAHSPPSVDLHAGVLTLNLDVLNFAKCLIFVPAGPAVDIQGVNGQMEVESPQDHLNIAINNGRVKIKPDPSRVYDFEVKVKNGLQDFFPRSNSKEAVRVKVDVVNGLVKKE